jgi:hypothetical protein
VTARVGGVRRLVISVPPGDDPSFSGRGWKNRAREPNEDDDESGDESKSRSRRRGADEIVVARLPQNAARLESWEPSVFSEVASAPLRNAEVFAWMLECEHLGATFGSLPNLHPCIHWARSWA